MLTLAHRAMLGAASRPKPPVQLHTLRSAGTATDSATAVAVDGSGNRVIVGKTGSPQAGFVAKVDADGNLLWQRKLSLGEQAIANAVAVDGSGNVYVAAQGIPSGSISACYTIKFNSSGTLQWQRKLSTSYSAYGHGVVLDGSGDVYVLAWLNDTKQTALLAKYSSGGTIQWQRVVSHASQSLQAARGLSIDSGGNLYFAVSHVITASSDTWGLVVKCSSSGVVQSRYASRIGASFNLTYGTTVDASGNMYVCGQSNTSGVPGTVRPYVCKLNSSGALQWHRWFSGDTALSALSAVRLSDDETHVYAAGTKYLFKFLASDGSLVWQRSLTGPASAAAAFGMMAPADGFLYTASDLQSMPSTGTDALSAKLPDDGSGLGTYGTVIVYSESTLTSNVGSPSTATPTITDAAGSLTEAAGDMTDAAGTLTYTPYL